MSQKIIKVYTYTRVSTAIQVDGYSLDAQQADIEEYCKRNGFQIVGRYSDEGKSGKSISGRPQFVKMLSDVKLRKDEIKYILVFKLSRFGRSSVDILNALKHLQKYGVNLLCTREGINSEEGTGKLMINIMAAVAEIERENIHEYTMEGRLTKASKGLWNGGFSPYGYKLVNGMLMIEEEEAKAVRMIFEQFVHTNLGYVGVAKYLENHGIKKIPRQNGKLSYFSSTMVKDVLDNPVYMGKISYGRTKQKQSDTDPDKVIRVETKDYEIYDGAHEAIVSEELYWAAQRKRKETAHKLEKKHDLDHEHILSGIVKCPICGMGMYGDISRNKRKDGTYYKTYFRYVCKHRVDVEGKKCSFKRTISEDKLNNAVAEIIKNLISKPEFAKVLRKKVEASTDIMALNEELAEVNKQIANRRQAQKRIMSQQDDLDFTLPGADKMYDDLNERIEKAYEKIIELEQHAEELQTRIVNANKDKISAENIQYFLRAFGQLYDVMSDTEKKTLYNSLVKEVQIYETPLENGQEIKSIKFSFPIDESGTTVFCVDKNTTVESVVLMSRVK